MTATKSRSRSAIMNKGGERTKSFIAKSQTETVGPGQYERGDEFGKNVKGLGFGKPKPEKKIVDNRDYGYNPEREFK